MSCFLFPFSWWWPSLRNTACRFFALQDSLGNVEGAIAPIIFIQIRVPVIAGTDNIHVFLLLSRSEPAGTCPVAIPAFIYDKTLYKSARDFFVGIKMMAPRLGFFVQSLV